MNIGGIPVGGESESISSAKPGIKGAPPALGDVNQPDVDKFTYRLSEGENVQTAKINVTLTEDLSAQKIPSGPFDFQTNRLKFDVVEKAGKGEIGKMVLDQIKKYKASDLASENKLKSLSEEPATVSTSLKIQMELVKMTTGMTLFSEVAKNLVKAVQTLARNQ